MKQFLEIIPILLFFITYKMDGQQLSLLGFDYRFDGIYSATAVLIIATAVQLLLTRIFAGHIEKRLWWIFIAVMVFGGATILLRNELFIQWKPSIVNWVFATAFFVTPFLKRFGNQTILQRTMGSQLSLPQEVWLRLNNFWVFYFLVVGALNLFVAFNFSEAFWVDYKLYSALGFTLLLMVVTGFIVGPHLKDEAK